MLGKERNHFDTKNFVLKTIRIVLSLPKKGKLLGIV